MCYMGLIIESKKLNFVDQMVKKLNDLYLNNFSSLVRYLRRFSEVCVLLRLVQVQSKLMLKIYKFYQLLNGSL